MSVNLVIAIIIASYMAIALLVFIAMFWYLSEIYPNKEVYISEKNLEMTIVVSIGWIWFLLLIIMRKVVLWTKK